MASNKVSQRAWSIASSSFVEASVLFATDSFNLATEACKMSRQKPVVSLLMKVTPSLISFPGYTNPHPKTLIIAMAVTTKKPTIVTFLSSVAQHWLRVQVKMKMHTFSSEIFNNDQFSDRIWKVSIS
jgi:hypothetical protein